jgi:hypothetical protein
VLIEEIDYLDIIDKLDQITIENSKIFFSGKNILDHADALLG